MSDGNPLDATEGGDTGLLTNFDRSPGDFEHGGLTKATEGAGIFTSVASTVQDAANGNWGGFAMDLGADALDALGVAMDPLGSLGAAGIGWLIEHVSFLKKPLDWLAGDPDEVTKKAQTLQNVSDYLKSSAANYAGSVGVLQQTQGAAADGYRQAAADYQTAVTGLSAHIDGATKAMHTAATIVGTTRGVVRDTIAQFAADAVIKFIAAQALAPVTFGASEAAFIADEVVEGTSVAAKNTSKVTKAAKETQALAKGAKQSKNTLRETGDGFAKATSRRAKAEEFNTRAASHTERVHEHGASSAEQLNKEAAHNARAVENDMNLGANRRALGENQREIDRALANKDRGDIRAGNRERGPLKEENTRLNAEDRALNREQRELEQGHRQLGREGKDINAESRDLAAERERLIAERSNFGVGPAKDFHHWLEEQGIRGTLGEKAVDTAKEAGTNITSGQDLREKDVQDGYRDEHKDEKIPDGSFVSRGE